MSNINKVYLGIEFGSTRIKAVAIDDHFQPVSAGDFSWKSTHENGIWTYDLEDAWTGLKTALSQIDCRDRIDAVGISGMMHGYLAFDKDWKLLVPFRTWQNTITGDAAQELSTLFNFNVPQRWSIAHLYQAILNKEPHVKDIAHITTLAGYIHYKLTGINAVGIGEASGMFPIDSKILDYDQSMLEKLEALLAKYDFPWKLGDILPKVLTAGDAAGSLTAEGSTLIDGLLSVGTSFCPPEGDAGTGMTATNSVAAKTGNVSAGTSIFSMVVLEKPMKKTYPEIDMVVTPSGKPVAMVHCNNCTIELNAWVNMFSEVIDTLGFHIPTSDLITALFNKSLSADTDAGGLLLCNYVAGESVTHMNEGRPLFARKPNSDLSLANFMRTQIYAAFATLCIGMKILKNENVEIESLTGHGGLFKTPVVAQSYLAAACEAPVTCMKTAGEGGPYGMALLASFMQMKEECESLEAFLKKSVFTNTECLVIPPEKACVEGFKEYLKDYELLLEIEKKAVEVL